VKTRVETLFIKANGELPAQR